MSISGSLSDFSLREIFRFVGKGQKTGLLTLIVSSESKVAPSSVHYIWMSKGNVVAAANQLNNQGLVFLIDRYPWISNRVVTKLAQFCPPNQALGLYLRNQGALQIEQLEHLFQIQIAQQLCVLFQVEDAQFRFEQNVSIPTQELTGLSVPATVVEVMMQKLVMLQKFFESRNQLRESSRLHNGYKGFCSQLCLILDTAFFHSLNFSLFDTKNSFAKLSQAIELSYRPYDLPNPEQAEAMCCTSS